MFTGIVESVGEVIEVTETTGGRRLNIGVDIADELANGQSVNVSGVCLTVEGHTAEAFDVFLARETIDKTYLGDLTVGDAVNIERALPASGRFDGHIVQGHVDTTTEISAIREVGEDWEFEFALGDWKDYVVEKGSIALDGISLTVASRDTDTFSVAIIPATYRQTTLSAKKPGDPVHVEVDVIAKYVEQLLST